MKLKIKTVDNTLLITLAITALLPAIGMAQSFPAKPIRIVTSEPGSGNDLVARVIAHALGGTIGQNVVVDNRGILAGEITAKSPGDGYTLICYGSPLWLAPFLRSKVPYDPVKDFAPITIAATSPNVLVAHPSFPAATVSELIALLKARPGSVNYASASAGSSSHLAGELFKLMTDVDLVRVPYRGTGPAVNALLGGHVQIMFAIAASAMPYVKSNKLKILAVTSLKQSFLVPGVPTVADAGLPGYEAGSIQGVFAAAGTPASTVDILNSAIRAVLLQRSTHEKLLGYGVETVGSSSTELAMTVNQEMSKLGKLIRDKNIRSD